MPDIGQALVDANALTDAQVQEARSGGGDLATALIDRRMLDEPEYTSVVARAFSLDECRVESIVADAEALALIPEPMARNGGCIPIKKEGAMLHVAIADPGNDKLVDRLARSTGLSIKLFVAGPQGVQKAIDRLYGTSNKAARRREPGDAVPALQELDHCLKTAIQEVAADDGTTGEDLTGLSSIAINPLDPPVIRVINALLSKALKMRASDVHIEPLETELRVRLRIDGVLVEVLRLPGEMKSAIVSRLKIMSSMDIAEKRVPQDGGIKLALNEKESIDFRVSSLPSIYGEKVVLRVLGNSELRGSVDDLGFEGRALESVREAIANPYGMILVTGPTGSGKTTTLYTILSQLNEDDVNIVTAEDPVEYRLNGINQVNVRAATGLTFDAALRSFLRQDPDIILVGEMRDYETSAIAVKAALTGHLVLSTLHTNDAPSTVVRLVDMGIEPYLVASAVKLVIAQRLVRRICSNCKEDVDISEAERTDLNQEALASIEYMSRGAGCDVCNGIGYKGRMPLFEVMSVKSKEMKRAITEGGTEVQVGQIARREGMLSLTENAIDLVNRGLTTLEEAMSIIVAE